MKCEISTSIIKTHPLQIQITLMSFVFAKASLMSMRSLKYFLSRERISVRDHSNHALGISHPKGHSHQGNVAVSPLYQSQKIIQLS